MRWNTILMTLCFAALAAAEGNKTRNRGLDRQDFDAYLSTSQSEGAPGVKVQIELERSGVKRLANPNEMFYEGDVVSFLVTTNFDAKLQVVNTEQGGEPSLLFPKTGETNEVGAGMEYRSPSFVFDGKTGVEKVQLILADAKEETPAAQKMDTAGCSTDAWKAEGQQVVEDANKQTELKGRGLARMERKDEVVVLADTAQKPFREPTAVTLALRHGAK